MSSFVDSLLSLAIAKQDKLKEDSPDVDSDHEGGAGSSHTSQNEYNGTASQQSTSADELENEEPATKRFRSGADGTPAPSSHVNLAELFQNVKVLSHQIDLVMKKLNVRPCECKDCCVSQKRLISAPLKRPRPATASTPAPRPSVQNGETAVSTTSNASFAAQTPSAAMTPPVNLIQSLQEQTHCPTIRGRGRGRPMLIGDELHNALVDYLVNYEIMHGTRLYPMDAFRHAQSFIKQHSPGLLAEEGGSVVLKQSWAVKLVTHVRSRKQKLIELVSQSASEQPEDIVSKLSGEVASFKQSHENVNSLNGLVAAHQHVVPEHFGTKQDFSNDSTTHCDSDIVVEKVGLETDSSKLGLDADPAQLASFASLLASLQQPNQ
ncbi:hypothetical protein QR680_005422 [Steinernema hermaphroditum]|uniref:Uncharacterized protein n=1 Tax=Steinernema hermaphroditum TaxID=289476 RepID=A0AA39HTE4_9BILA|nr:hypothetical protein QR680_005422 [Steinernema hermaphroditum]